MVSSKHSGIPSSAAQVLQTEDRLDHLGDGDLGVGSAWAVVESCPIQVVGSLWAARVNDLGIREIIRLSTEICENPEG